MMKRYVLLFPFLVFLSACPAPSTQNSKNNKEVVLYAPSSKILRDSKWGKIAEFEHALNDTLKSCRKNIIKADGVFDRETQSAIITLTDCKKFSDLKSTRAGSGAITTLLWRRLLPKNRLPTVHERAFALSLTYEATDYDRIEWNYGTSDDRSALTWGPYGATVGWGNEVRGILKIVAKADQNLVQKTFAEEFPTLKTLLAADPSQGYQILKPVYASPEKRKTWKTLFEKLGAKKEVQQSYQSYALESNHWLKPALKRLYTLIPKGKATEIDYAFFLDLSMHMGISGERITTVKTAIEDATRKKGTALKPAERRQVISKYLVPKGRKMDRLGRNGAYYLEALKADQISEEERDAWEKRSGLTASQVGLSDERIYDPGFILD